MSLKAAVLSSSATASSSLSLWTLQVPVVAYCWKFGFHVVMRTAPRIPDGKNFDISIVGSSALSMIKSQWSLPDSQDLTGSRFSLTKQTRAIARAILWQLNRLLRQPKRWSGISNETPRLQQELTPSHVLGT